MAEKEYIDKQDAIKEIYRFDGYLDDDMIWRLHYAIRKIPAADVRPVVRGKWVKHNATHVQKGGMYLECSCCHEYITVLGHVFAYCPNCWADMREVTT